MQLQRLVNYWLLHRGFSVGSGDMEVSESTLTRIGTVTSNATAAVADALQRAVVSVSLVLLMAWHVVLQGALCMHDACSKGTC